MRGNKQQRNIKQQLCLLLAVILVCGAVPLESVLAVESETMLETEALTVETQTEEMQTGELQEPETEPAESTEPEESEPDEEPEESGEPENTTYANSISGVLWIDANEDGAYDAGEQPLADYPVYLYAENDQDNAVDTATTDADGEYLFEDISPGRYVVGIKAEENGTEYLLPLMGVQNDNKFYFTPDYSKVISNPIDIAADTVVEDIDAAMRMMPQIQPMANATYTIDINNPVITGIPGVTYASGILTFTTSVDLTDTYIITGTGASTTNRIVVNGGVGTALAPLNITLDGASISNAVSPIQLQGTANVNLTLSGTNTLTCTGTSTTVGAVQAGIYVQQNTTLTIEGNGTLDVRAGYGGAAIGGIYASTTLGGSPPNGTVIINSGTITAYASSGGAVIGGGSHGSGGTITINGGTVTVSGGGTNSGAGIGGGGAIANASSGGGGNGGIITINGGTVTAIGGNQGAGIGGGFNGTGGTITISGGEISTRGGNRAAGIGGGSTGTGGMSGGNITISGGTVTATSGIGYGSYYPAGIGGGSGTSSSNAASGTNIFTSGSIYPTRSDGTTVSVATSTTNGSTYGPDTLYMTMVTVVDIDDIPVANALVTIEALGSSQNYTYTATSNASGIAYVWLRTNTTTGYTFEAEDPVLGYGCEDKTVAANNNNAVTIKLGMRTTLSKTPTGIAFITPSNPKPVTLSVKAENAVNTASSDIVSAEWFRVETTDATTYTKSTFNTGYTAAVNTDKGDTTDDMTEDAGGSNTERNYSLPVDQNGTYWVMVHYLDGLGVDRYQVKSIAIDNVYTPSTGNYKGINSGDGSTLYDEAIPGLTNASGDPIVGVAFELNSTATILTSTSDGTTAVAGTGATLTINAKNLAPLWITSAPTSQTVSVTGTNLGTTTFNYTLNPLAITVQFNSQGGTPSTIANQYYMSTDTFGTLPSVARTGYNFDGWFTAATGGTQVNVTDITGSHFASGSTATLYAQWTASAKTVTISNEVTGAYANMDKSFTYTIYFQDNGGTALASGTQFTYTGGVIAGSGATAPANGTLTLGSGGEATVTLTTGHTITIAGVSTSGKVRVVQTTDANYTTSFKDSLDASSTTGADTGVRSMTATDRTFDFTNTRSVVPGGISTGSGEMVLLSLMALLALVIGFAITVVYRRRTSAR